MTEAEWAALGVALAAALSFLAAVLVRRQQAPLVTAQVVNENAETTEIVDRIARDWIARLEERCAQQDKEIAALRTEVATLRATNARNIAVLIGHIGVLEDHIVKQLPPPPPARPHFGD